VVSAVVFNGTFLNISNVMTVTGTSSATVTVTARDPSAFVNSSLTVVFSFSTGPPQSLEQLDGALGGAWGGGYEYIESILTNPVGSSTVWVPVGSSTVWVYTLSGYQIYAGYQIQYDSVAKEWQTFLVADHPVPCSSAQCIKDVVVSVDTSNRIVVKESGGTVLSRLNNSF
jgi:hypothetical protein